MNKFVIEIAVRNANITKGTGITEDLPSNYIERCLESAVQDYPDYRIVIRDDASIDGTWEIIKEKVKIFDVPVDMAQNPERIGVVANHYQMSQLIDDDEIIVILDGDDQLYHKNVLQILDSYYDNPDTWMTYGSYGYDEPSRNPAPNSDWRGHSAPMENCSRTGGFGCSHLRTYKRWLFDRIRIEDLKFNGEFYQKICDHVTMFPMIEMAGPEHSVFIPDILYLYNAVNPYNEFKGPGGWPVETEAQKKLKEIGELESGHSKILIIDEIDEIGKYFCSLPPYPRLPYAKAWPNLNTRMS